MRERERDDDDFIIHPPDYTVYGRLHFSYHALTDDDVDNDDDSVDDDDDGAYDDDDDELKKNSLDDDVIAIELGDIDVFHSPVFTSSIFISCSVDVT